MAWSKRQPDMFPGLRPFSSNSYAPEAQWHESYQNAVLRQIAAANAHKNSGFAARFLDDR
jgi:hypothetical protein